MQDPGIDRAKQASDALRFVRDIRLPRIIRLRAEGARPAFDPAKDQATVVGSEIISFVRGVPAPIRDNIVNCSLLAQLAAKKVTSGQNNSQAWYDVYFDTLTAIGFAVEERGFAQYHQKGNDLEAHKAILKIAATLFGPASTALAVVESTLDAMHSFIDGPWLTIFKRESETATAGRFQVTVVEPARNSGSTLGLMAFELEGNAMLTQILFFKFRSSDVILRHASGKVTIDTEILDVISAELSQKIAAYARSYVAELPL
jgi:hypothetical protein